MLNTKKLLEKSRKIYHSVSIDEDDDDQMRIHILQCIAALSIFERRLKSDNLDAFQKAKCSSFWCCMSDMVRDASNRESLSQPSLTLFRDIYLQSDDLSKTDEWLPLHCAAACKDLRVDEIQAIGTKLITHREKVVGQRKVTPHHIAAAVRNPNTNIMRRLITLSMRMGRMKDSNGDLPLNYASKWSNSVKMIQELLQAYPEGAFAKNLKGETCAHLLCSNSCVEAPDMLRVVLAAKASIARSLNNDGDLPLHYVIQSELPATSRLDMALQLIHAYPEGVAVRNRQTKETCAHLVCSSSWLEAPDLLRFVLAAESSLASIVNDDGDLPLHCVIQSELSAATRVDMALQLIRAYPEGVGLLNKDKSSPLHKLCKVTNWDITRILEVMLHHSPAAASIPEESGVLPLHLVRHKDHAKRLIEVYPEALSVNDTYHGTPLHQAIMRNDVELLCYLYCCRPESIHDTFAGLRMLYCCVHDSISFAMLRAVYELDPTVVTAVDNHGCTLLNTLHLNSKGKTVLSWLISANFSCFHAGSPSPVALNKLYFLLQKYPEAASIQDNSGRTPYALCHESYTSVRRLLLRAAPSLSPVELRHLNYSARRLALFLFYFASREDGRPTLFAKLSLSSKSLGIVRGITRFL